MIENSSIENDSLDLGLGGVLVKDSKVIVKDPTADVGILAITPCEGVELVINGVAVTGRTAVREKDEIVLKPLTVEEPGSYKITVAPDCLSAKLEVSMGTTTVYSIMDAGPEINLTLKAERRSEKKCPFTLVDILQGLSGKNITFGIKHSEIQAIMAGKEDGSYLIAEGTAPGETINDRVELKFNDGQEGQKVKDSSDKVNFRDLGEILSVEPGTLLAERYVGSQGKPGRKVSGEMIIPPKPVACDITAGKGVEVSSDGSKVISKVSGRPIAKRLGKGFVIDVDPILHKKGDIDIQSGNIRFKGDVVVHGNVCEGMTVQAAGRINVLGMIFGAQIAAQGDITAVQNITGGNLVAGGNNSFFKAFYKHLDALQSDLTEVGRMVSGMAEQAKIKNVKTGQLVQLLIDKKYARVHNLISEIIKISGQNTFIIPRDMVDLLETIEKKLSGLNVLKIESPEEFNRIIAEIKDVQKTIENMAENKANITFAYSVNSKIEASGDVKVEGGGCLNTNINAGGNVTIKGVFRGGEIQAGGNIILNEAGSEMGARTLIKAESGRKIMIRKAYEGVRLQIGGRMASITEMQNNIKAELDDVGTLVISY
ncbi:DUF342 domain-containing protein [Pelotomaculum propionicicum]|uniref:DUF342 domain-containing protein n=1 Tax=Pelotomaculum propionicicum TaxID=258475 RepID=UPI003B7EB52B